jgi:hypothetical protein
MKIKSRLNSGNASCDHHTQHLSSFRLLSKKINIKTYKSVICSVVLFGCETWSVTLTEEQRLTVFENMLLRKIFRPKRQDVTVVRKVMPVHVIKACGGLEV